jgi:hypothetical protein
LGFLGNCERKASNKEFLTLADDAPTRSPNTFAFE